MKKAWSLFWLVIASVFALQFIGAMVEPWLPLMGIALVVIVVIVIASKVLALRRKRRQFF